VRVDDRLAASSLDTRGDRVAVDIVDLPAAAVEVVAGADEFLASRDNPDFGGGPDRNAVDAECRQQADLSGRDPSTGTERPCPGGDVRARDHHVVAGCHRGANLDSRLAILSLGFVGSFDDHDRVSPFGHHCPRRDLNADAGVDRHTGLFARVDDASKIERDWVGLVGSEGVAGPDRVAVHRGTVEPWHVDFGVDTLGEHATMGRLEVDLLGAATEFQRVDRLAGFGGVGQRAELLAAHGWASLF